MFSDVLDGSVGKESACNAGDPGSIPRLGRSPGEGKAYSLQYSDLGNSRDYTVHGGQKELDTTKQLSFLFSAIFRYLTVKNTSNNKMLYFILSTLYSKFFEPRSGNSFHS